MILICFGVWVVMAAVVIIEDYLHHTPRAVPWRRIAYALALTLIGWGMLFLGIYMGWRWGYQMVWL
jgi:hypothetical protein